MTYRYKAHLSNELVKDECFSRVIPIPSIADAQSGFWVNEALEFTRGEDNDAWVPPAQILFVEKVTDELFFVSKEIDETL